MPITQYDSQEHYRVQEKNTPAGLLIAGTPQHRNVIEYMRNGYAFCRMITLEGNGVDFIHEEVNQGYEKLTGLKNVAGRSMTEIMPGLRESNPEFIERHRLVVESGIPDQFEVFLVALNKWFDITIYRPEEGYSVAMFDDITERKLMENELQRTSRALMAINNCNQALVHSENEMVLLQKVCDIIVNTGGYRMAWVGYAENDAGKSVTPVAQAGFEEGYLRTSIVSWADVPLGQGPTGSAIRTGKPFFLQNIREDPQFTLWRSEAIKRGYASNLSLPLKVNKAVIGALTIYSEVPHAFNPKEIKLLASLIHNLNYGIEKLRSRNAHQKAENELKISELRFRRLFEQHSATMILIDPESGKIIDANHAAAKFYGWTIEEMRKMCIQQITNVTSDEVKCNMRKARTSEQNQFLFRHKKSDGSLRDVEVFSNTINIDGKDILYAIIHDITERKRYESLTEFRLRILQMARTHSVEELLMTVLDKEENDISLKSLFDGFPEEICLIDRNGTILLANDVFKNNITEDQERNVGRSYYDFLAEKLINDRTRKIEEVLFTGEAITFDEVQHKKILRNSIFPVPNKEGDITKLLLFSIDVTTLQLSKQEEFDQRVYYRNLFNNMENGFAYCRVILKNESPVDFVFEVVNLNFKRLTGWDCVEGRKISDFIPNIVTSNPEFIVNVGRISQSGVAEQFEFYFDTLNRWFDITVYSHQKGYFVMVLSPMITFKIGNWEWNVENGVMVWNDELRMLYGQELHSGIPSYELWRNSIMPGDKENTDKVIKEAVEKGGTFNVVYKINDSHGTIRRLMTQGFAVKNDTGDVNRYMGITIDISEYKNINTNHLINTTNLNTLLNSSEDAACSISRNGIILETNGSFDRIYSSYNTKGLKDTDFNKLFSKQLLEDRNNKFKHLFETGEPIHFKDKGSESRGALNSENDYIYQLSAYPVYGEYEKIEAIAVFISNSNEYNEAEKARRQFDKQYQTLIAASPDSIITTTLDGFISSVSDIGLEIFGANNKTDVIGKPFSSIVYQADIPIIKEIFDVTFREGLIQNKEILLKKKNNTLYSAEISAALIQDYNGAPSSYMLIIRDISQRKIIESELFHAKRLISLGEMASGIAHEIYQPINNIGLIVDKILFEASKNRWSCENDIKIKSEKIFENIIRVQTIIDNIRSFSSTDNNYISSVVNINKGIRNALLMFSEQCKHRSILLEFKPDKERISVTGNIYKFEQVISNLIKNSIDALEEKKQVNNTSFEMKILIRSFYKDDSVRVTIEDNGIGISEKDIGYIMHPFYTTKDSGKGTGLGLSISYGIIKEMSGDIKIVSNQTNGTTVIITLPKTAKNQDVIA